MGRVKAYTILIAMFVLGFIAFVMSVFALILSPIAPKLRYQANQFFLRPFGKFVRWLVGIKLIILNKDRVSVARPCVLVGNHQSALDFAIISQACPGGMIIVAKRELKFIPIFGWYFQIAGNLLIDRSNPRTAKSQLEAARALIKRENLNLAIFPEGTRSRNQEMLPFKKGAFHVAVSMGFPIVPVVCSSLSGKAVWEKKDLKGGHVVVSVMEAIPTLGISGDRIDALRDEVRNLMVVEFARISELASAYDERGTGKKSESCCN
jgi:1-acyl-sn-glycerol-3-phosphate acyltransferase